MPDVSHGDGAVWFLNTSLQISRRVEWKDGSFQIIPRDFSTMVKGSIEIDVLRFGNFSEWERLIVSGR